MIERFQLTATNRPIETLSYWRRTEGLLLTPPYQRGDVWGPIRQRNLIRSLLLGIPIPSIIVNDRTSAGWDDMISCAVIDGKQRITAVLAFLDDKLAIPGHWIGSDAAEVVFSALPIAQQRRIKNLPIPFAEGRLRSIEEEIEVFELINFGGVPQGESDFPLAMHA